MYRMSVITAVRQIRKADKCSYERGRQASRISAAQIAWYSVFETTLSLGRENTLEPREAQRAIHMIQLLTNICKILPVGIIGCDWRCIPSLHEL